MKWLIESLAKCRSPDCLGLFVNSLQNTQNAKLAPILLNLVEDNSRKGRSFLFILNALFLIANLDSVSECKWMLNDNISDERIDAKKAKDRRLVAIAAMKGLAEMPANDIITAIDGNANVEGAVSKARREIDIYHLYIS